jgi:hypothetical protein
MKNPSDGIKKKTSNPTIIFKKPVWISTTVGPLGFAIVAGPSCEAARPGNHGGFQ